MYLAQGHNTITLVRLEPVVPGSPVKHCIYSSALQTIDIFAEANHMNPNQTAPLGSDLGRYCLQYSYLRTSAEQTRGTDNKIVISGERVNCFQLVKSLTFMY